MIKGYIRLAAIVADFWIISYLIYLAKGTWMIIPLLITGAAIIAAIVIDLTEENSK